MSTTLQEVTWNASLIKDHIVEGVTRLKALPSQDVLVFGSGDLVQLLQQQDLIDEYRLMIFPVVVGSGKRLFREGNAKKVWHLAETTTFSSRVVVLTIILREKINPHKSECLLIH